ncbi:MAG: hypothetical protein WC523_00095 [Patescibacteria group bacterium]
MKITQVDQNILFPGPKHPYLSPGNYVVDLPEKGLVAFYISGTRLSIGIAGSDCNVIFMGNKLILRHISFLKKDQIIMEFKTSIYTYNVFAKFHDDFDAKLISIIRK